MSDDEEISVHDNVLVSYEVLCERREIRLRTEYRERGEPYEATDVLFTGVVAYDFQHDSEGATILFHISEVPPDDIYAGCADEFREGIRYGWPGQWAQSAASAAAHFQQHSTRGFEIRPSCGMGGWVLASGMQMQRRPN